MNVYFYTVKIDGGEDLSEEIERRRDELLDIYSLYLKTGIPSIKQELIQKAFELHLRDPKFSFVI